MPLDGAFLNYISEQTDGYAIRVTDATIMSPKEYVERYGEHRAELSENSTARTVLCLTIDIRNQGNDTGGFYIQGALLAPKGEPVRYVRDGELWHESNRNIDAMTLFLRVIPNTEFTLHVPYTRTDNQDDLTGGQLSFVVSTVPIRHIIDITVAS